MKLSLIFIVLFATFNVFSREYSRVGVNCSFEAEVEDAFNEKEELPYKLAFDLLYAWDKEDQSVDSVKIEYLFDVLNTTGVQNEFPELFKSLKSKIKINYNHQADKLSLTIMPSNIELIALIKYLGSYRLEWDSSLQSDYFLNVEEGKRKTIQAHLPIDLDHGLSFHVSLLCQRLDLSDDDDSQTPIPPTPPEDHDDGIISCDKYLPFKKSYGIFDFQIYSGSNISLMRANVNGPIAARKNINLNQSSLKGDQRSGLEHTIYAGLEAQLDSSNVYGNIEAQMAFYSNSTISGAIFTGHPTVDHQKLTNQLVKTSKDFSQLKTLPYRKQNEIIHFNGSHFVNVFNVSDYDFENSWQVRINGDFNQYFIINVRGNEIDFSRKNIWIDQRIDISKVIFNFYQARDLNINKSGETNGRGIPFSILAPNAHLTFKDSLITGGIYAGSFMVESPGAQFNYGFFKGSLISNNNICY